eukprot:m.509794 g.509794  ORF g.509794 m.509794 type:complete len:222 (-) comp95306_c0_seq1:101-766(-)
MWTKPAMLCLTASQILPNTHITPSDLRHIACTAIADKHGDTSQEFDITAKARSHDPQTARRSYTSKKRELTAERAHEIVNTTLPMFIPSDNEDDEEAEGTTDEDEGSTDEEYGSEEEGFADEAPVDEARAGKQTNTVPGPFAEHSDESEEDDNVKLYTSKVTGNTWTTSPVHVARSLSQAETRRQRANEGRAKEAEPPAHTPSPARPKDLRGYFSPTSSAE